MAHFLDNWPFHFIADMDDEHWSSRPAKSFAELGYGSENDYDDWQAILREFARIKEKLQATGPLHAGAAFGSSTSTRGCTHGYLTDAEQDFLNTIHRRADGYWQEPEPPS